MLRFRTLKSRIMFCASLAIIVSLFVVLCCYNAGCGLKEIITKAICGGAGGGFIGLLLILVDLIPIEDDSPDIFWI